MPKVAKRNSSAISELLLGSRLQAEGSPVLEEGSSVGVEGGQVLGCVGLYLLAVQPFLAHLVSKSLDHIGDNFYGNFHMEEDTISRPAIRKRLAGSAGRRG